MVQFSPKIPISITQSPIELQSSILKTHTICICIYIKITSVQTRLRTMQAILKGKRKPFLTCIYRNRENKIHMIRISFFEWDNSPEECVFFYDQEEESFVLSNSNFIYSYSYIFPSVREFGDGSVWTKPWS